MVMSGSSVILSRPAIPPEAREFVVKKGINPYLNEAIDLAQQALPSSNLRGPVGQEAEDETHRYIALDVEASELTTEELLAGQRTWTEEIGRVCPSCHAVYFVLGWQ